jgi:hypothetical protein
MKSTIFWNMTPCSLLICNRPASKQMARCLLAGSCWIISSTLNMEAICSSETSVATHQTTRRRIQEDDTLLTRAQFESRPGRRLSSLRFLVFPLFLQVHAGIALRLGHDRFLSNSSFITHPIIRCSILQILIASWNNPHKNRQLWLGNSSDKYEYLLYGLCFRFHVYTFKMPD